MCLVSKDLSFSLCDSNIEVVSQKLKLTELMKMRQYRTNTLLHANKGRSTVISQQLEISGSTAQRQTCVQISHTSRYDNNMQPRWMRI